MDKEAENKVDTQNYEPPETSNTDSEKPADRAKAARKKSHKKTRSKSAPKKNNTKSKNSENESTSDLLNKELNESETVGNTEEFAEEKEAFIDEEPQTEPKPSEEICAESDAAAQRGIIDSSADADENQNKKIKISSHKKPKKTKKTNITQTPLLNKKEDEEETHKQLKDGGIPDDESDKSEKLTEEQSQNLPAEKAEKNVELFENDTKTSDTKTINDEEQDLVSFDSSAAAAVIVSEDIIESSNQLTQISISDTEAKSTEEIAQPQDETALKQPAEKQAKKINKLLLSGIIVFLLLITYFGLAQYFKTHFYFGISVNGINISAKSIEGAKEKLEKSLDYYTLTLIERNGKTEQLKSTNLNLEYNSLGDLKSILDEQNGYSWIKAVFSEDSKKTIVVSYDEKKLAEQINNLDCFKPENIIEPKSPGFKYTKEGYEIEEEIQGCKVDKDVLYPNVADAVSLMQRSLNLEENGCYVKPKYTTQSQKTLDVQNLLNKYVKTKITYIVGDEKRVIDYSYIASWLSVDDDLNIIINQNAVKAYVNELSEIYKKCRYVRSFKTSSGNIVKISGGDYGRYINKAAEIDYVNSAIKTGDEVVRNFNDIGDTYVEISISNQHAWFYKNGKLIVDGPIVTGNVRQHHSTPKGVYSLKHKSRNATLKGRDYEAKVSYWMPFNGGIGMHDASWRGRFGGRIYRSSGSHGCVNMPYYMAKKIFYNISRGTPVVVY